MLCRKGCGTMRRSTLNYLIDALLLLAMLGMLWTGLVVRFILPPGTGGRDGGRALTLWGQGRHDWGDVHYLLVFVTVGLIVLHVALHWDWVCDVTLRLLVRGERESGKRRPGLRIAGGAIFLLGITAAFGLGLWTAAGRVQQLAEPGASGYRGGRSDRAAPDGRGEPDNPREGDAGQGRGAGQGWGSQTLAEIETRYGVPLAVLRRELRLPETVPSTTRLARLRQEYGISMSTLQDVIRKYQRLSGVGPWPEVPPQTPEGTKTAVPPR